MTKEMSQKEFNVFLAKETAKELAKEYNLSFEQAWNLFKKSNVYEWVINSDGDYDQEMPVNIIDQWKNEKLFGYGMFTESISYGALKGKRLS